LRIAPVGKVCDSPRRCVHLVVFVRLYDIQSVLVEEERVIAEQLV
jgi:hypothetical protein